MQKGLFSYACLYAILQIRKRRYDDETIYDYKRRGTRFIKKIQ